MARRGDLSKVALVDGNRELFCGTGSLFIRFSMDVNMLYIHRSLSGKSTTEFLLNQAQGITMPNLNKEIIRKIPVLVPPLNLQTQFAQKIQLIEKQKELAKQSLKESEDLFQSLLQKAFKGELSS
jgi:type I restriction enzyme, S subunit